jgi:hypothetical protein
MEWPVIVITEPHFTLLNLEYFIDEAEYKTNCYGPYIF